MGRGFCDVEFPVNWRTTNGEHTPTGFAAQIHTCASDNSVMKDKTYERSRRQGIARRAAQDEHGPEVQRNSGTFRCAYSSACGHVRVVRENEEFPLPHIRPALSGLPPAIGRPARSNLRYYRR